MLTAVGSIPDGEVLGPDSQRGAEVKRSTNAAGPLLQGVGPGVMGIVWVRGRSANGAAESVGHAALGVLCSLVRVW